MRRRAAGRARRRASGPVVESSFDEAGSFEHPDEDADVPLGRGFGEALGIDGAGSVSKGAIDASQLGGLRNVSDREPSERRRRGRAREHHDVAARGRLRDARFA